ncbi:MAG: site-specific DNA-methyltransferase, partial [Actinomycetota bacterium]|nr:site-specific DNA-methyltransferase [Actinomycetota bacterium]
SHDATQYGSRLLASFLPGRKFPFPKSLYAVEDALRFFIASKPEAVVVDFFAGSGTTAHAVMRLNRQDGGSRRSIMITNNEVSAEEAAELREAGLSPGDPEWEAQGIYEFITRPRLEAAVTGKTPDGEPIAGEYKFIDEFPISEGFTENLAFFELMYLDPDDVELDLAFESVAPLLWIRAGSQGPLIASRVNDEGKLLPYATTPRYGVLFDTDRWRSFVNDLDSSVSTVFVVTDSPTVFTGIVAELPAGVEAVRLYENYLATFAINYRRP